MSNKIKFGIIGCSRIALRATIPAIASSKNAEVSIVGSRTPQKAQAYAKKFGCTKFGTYQDVVESDADAVYISVPPSLHETWAVASAKYGKHVLCEKSAALSLLSAQKMVAAAKKKKVRIMEGFSFRFHPQHAAISALKNRGRLGEHLQFFGKYCLPMPSREDIRLQHNLGGGVLNDAGCYPLSASRMLLGEEPTDVAASLFFDRRFNVDTQVHAILKYASGKTAQIFSGYGFEYQSMYELHGRNTIISTQRAYSVAKDCRPPVFVTSNDAVKLIKITPADQCALMIADFCKTIAHPAKDFSFEDELIKQAKVMEAVRISAQKKKWVPL